MIANQLMHAYRKRLRIPSPEGGLCPLHTTYELM